MLPGILTERASGVSTPELLRSSALAARALATRGVHGDEAVSEAEARWLAVEFGRFPASFLHPNASGFCRLAAVAVTDDAAVADLASPLLAAGLFGIERDERRPLLESLPERLGSRVRREFEIERSRRSLTDLGRRAARESWSGAFGAPSLRFAAVGAIGAVFGDLWADELDVLSRSRHAQHGAPAIRFPKVDIEGRRDLAGWWVEVTS